MSTEARVTTLEHAMAELALAQAQSTAKLDQLAERTAANFDRWSQETTARFDRTAGHLDRLSYEILAFKDEMVVFKGGIRAFMDEMLVFKDEMRAFKDEMVAFKDESQAASKLTDRRLGELSNKMGTLAEDIVAPSIPSLFRELFGVEKPESIVRGTRLHRDDPGRTREFDVTAWGGAIFLVNETKSRLRPEDIEPFAQSLAEVRAYWHEAEQRKIVGAFSSFYLDPTLVKAAERAGLYVFGLGSGLLEVLNTPGFAPREF